MVWLKDKSFVHVTVLILFSVLVSCSKNTETFQKEPVVFSILYNDNKATPYVPDWLILQEYRQRANVLLDVKTGDDADFERAVFSAFDSGKIPDIVLKVFPSTIERYVSSGMILPFSDYEQYLPHFRSYIDEYELHDALDRLRMNDGKYYLLPGFRRQIQVQQWAYRKDVFELHNLPVPTTYEEMFEALVVLKQMYPDAVPITAVWGGAHLLAMMGAGYDIQAGWNHPLHYDIDSATWIHSAANERYRELLFFLHRCYQAGILDPEMFDQSNETYMQKVLDGRAFIIVTWITSGFGDWNNRLRENGVDNGEWAVLPVMKSTIGRKALPGVDPFRKGLIVPSRVATEPYFLELLSFLDWAVYSKEGRDLTTWGIEGSTYEQTEHGKRFLPHVKTPKNLDGTVDIRKEYGFDLIFNLAENEEHEDYKKPIEITTYLQRSLQADETAPLNPPLNISLHSLEIASMIQEKIAPYVTEMTKKFITGEQSLDTDWPDYINELENRGYKMMEAIYNEAYTKNTIKNGV